MPRAERLRLVCGAYGLLAGSAAVAFPAQSPATGILLIPLLCLAPGYAIVSALQPPDDEHPGEGWLVSVLLSLALVVLGGLLLNLLAVGLTTRSWAIYLAALTIVPLARWPRRRSEIAAAAPSLGAVARIAATAVATLALVTAAVVEAHRSAASTQQPRTTQLSVIRRAGQHDTRVDNRLGRRARYRLVITGSRSRRTQRFALNSGASRSFAIPRSGRVAVRLFLGTARRPARQVWVVR
jgi:hypothetical protein